MNDFDNRNNLDFQKDPLNSKNLTGVHWTDFSRKMEDSPFIENNEHYKNENNSLDSILILIYVILGFLGLMAFIGLIKRIFSFFYNLNLFQ